MSSDSIFFVSDVHLYYGGAEYMERFLRFLEFAGRTARALYIHGDLFDFYVGPRQGRLAFYAPLFERLERLASAGIPVTVLHGNRDFLMGRRFARSGVRVVPDELRLEEQGLRIHLSHGDQFCIHDHSYQFWARSVLRAAPARFVVRNAPVWSAIWIARRYRKVSQRKMAREHRTGKDRLTPVLDGVRQFLQREPGLDALICGHIHLAAETPIEVDGRTVHLFTTAAWEEAPNYIELRDGQLHLRRFDPNAVPVAGAGEA
jgi:UDP-2,3-diacylglucosamine hydrolase